jgi:hypothetical protein
VSTPNRRDERIADEAFTDRALMCAATGCPNRWSVDAGRGRLCSAHAWVSAGQWPQVTQEQIDAETDRALRNAAPLAPAAPYRDIPRLRHELGRLADGMRVARSDPRAWARHLRDREQRGEKLTDAQRAAWRSSLGAHELLDAVKTGAAAEVPQEDITTALQATGDLPSWADRVDVPAFDEESA